MVALVPGQAAVLEVFQVITLVPRAKLPTVVFAELGLATLPEPGGPTLHVPVVAPVNVFAANTAVGVLKQTVWLKTFVITAGLGGGSTSIVIVALVFGQAVVLNVVQVITFVPKAKLLTVVLAELGAATVPEPGGPTVQVPVVAPVKLFAANTAVGVLKQTVCEGELVITAGLGAGCTTTVIVALVPGQAAVFDVLQVMMLLPNTKLLIVVFAELGLAITPPAGFTDQVPVVAPVKLLAANTVVGVLKQTVWFKALVITAGLGAGCTSIVIVALVFGQAVVLNVVQVITFVPKAKLLTVVLAELGAATLPEPGGPTVQVPVVAPVKLFAANTAVGAVKQMVCEARLVITAGLGSGSTTMERVLLVEGHTPGLVTSQRIMVVPVPMPVILVSVDVWLAIKAVPLCTDQLPVPTAGLTALITVLGVPAQRVWLPLVTAALVSGCTTMVTLVLPDGQALLLATSH